MMVGRSSIYSLWPSALGKTLHCLIPAALAALALLTGPAAFADSPINLVLDQARMVKLPGRAATIVIGNPLIADASLQPGGVLVMTAKGYGTTNLIALDGQGDVLFEKRVQVKSPSLDTVVVYKGAERETYSCTPTCAPRITPGDHKDYFTLSLTQTTTRNSQASGMNNMAAQPTPR